MSKNIIDESKVKKDMSDKPKKLTRNQKRNLTRKLDKDAAKLGYHFTKVDDEIVGMKFDPQRALVKHGVNPRQEISPYPQYPPVSKDQAYNKSYTIDMTRDTKQMDYSKEIAALKKQLSDIKNGINDKTPLKRGGSQLTGTIAQVVHMFCDPGCADPVAVPGRDPEAPIKSLWTPNKSIPLTNGRAHVIATPMGKYQYFVSRGAAATSYGPTTTLIINPWNPGAASWTMPRLVKQRYKDGSVMTTTIFEPNTVISNTTDAIFITLGVGGSNFTFNLWNDGAGNEFYVGFSVPDLLTPNLVVNVAYTVNNVNFVFSAPLNLTGVWYLAHAGLADPEPNFLLLPNYPANSTALITNITFTYDDPNLLDPVFFNFTTAFEGVAGQTLLNMTFNNGVDSYDAKITPQLVAVSHGNLIDEGVFAAMSLLIGNDSAAINNSGFIYGATLTSVLHPPAGVAFEDWISACEPWNYKGPAKTGGYQVYIPTVHQIYSQDPATVSPWYAPQTSQVYNMVFILDNSVSINGAAVPDFIQAHVNVESVFFTPKLNLIIPAIYSGKDPGYELALGILRHFYKPCCNPDHKDNIKQWLLGTFNNLVSHGKSIITDHIAPAALDVALGAIKTGIPLAVSLLA